MIHNFLGCVGVLALIGSLAAEVVDTATFENAASVSFPGDPANELTFYDTAATAPFTLGAISWEGLARPTEDTGATGNAVFPTFGIELRARIIHDQSGEFADLTLGIGETFGPDGMQFTGSSYGLTGLLVDPGDSFSWEFYEDFDDPDVSPDATWESISFDFHDDRPGADVIRFDTTGPRPWPTEPGEPGAEYYGIEYGAGGSGPSITNLRLEGHDFFTFWFDQRTEIGIDDSGLFRANRLLGVSEPQVTFSDEDPSIDPDTGEPLFANTFGTLELAFPEGDFAPGDLIRFGVLTQTDDFSSEASGDQMAQLQSSGPLSLTVTFDDGTKVSAPLLEPDAGLAKSASVDLDVLDRAATSGGDADADGDVDGDDLLTALLGFGTRFGAAPSAGDADGQGDVDDDDLAIVIANLGNGVTPSGGLAATASVPEPSAGAILVVLTGVLLLRTSRVLRSAERGL